MYKIRRASVCLLLLLMLLSLAACGGPGGQKAGQPDTAPENPADVEPVEPAIPADPVEPVKPVDPVEPVEPEPDVTAPEADPEPEEPPAEAEEPEPIAAAKPTGSGYTEEAYDQVVAEVLDSITTSDMTKLEKAKAIWDYAKGKIRYTGTSDKTDWKEGAYIGMTDKAGDCFTYYAVSRALLTAADIDNLEVTRVGGSTSHYWNLVNCGDGWYHFDATPRSSKMPAFTSFMFTDEEAADYTARAGRSYYSFDDSLLPPRAGSEEASAPAPVETPAAQPEDTAPAVDTVDTAEPEPVLPENEIPLEAGAFNNEADVPEEMEMPDWLKPAGAA